MGLCGAAFALASCRIDPAPAPFQAVRWSDHRIAVELGLRPGRSSWPSVGRSSGGPGRACRCLGRLQQGVAQQNAQDVSYGPLVGPELVHGTRHAPLPFVVEAVPDVVVAESVDLERLEFAGPGPQFFCSCGDPVGRVEAGLDPFTELGERQRAVADRGLCVVPESQQKDVERSTRFGLLVAYVVAQPLQPCVDPFFERSPLGVDPLSERPPGRFRFAASSARPARSVPRRRPPQGCSSGSSSSWSAQSHIVLVPRFSVVVGPPSTPVPAGGRRLSPCPGGPAAFHRGAPVALKPLYSATCGGGMVEAGGNRTPRPQRFAAAVYMLVPRLGSRGPVLGEGSPPGRQHL